MKHVNRGLLIRTRSTFSVLLFSARIPATTAITDYNDRCPVWPEVAGDPVSAIDKIAGSTFAGGGFHGRSSTHEYTIRFDRFVMLPGAWLARKPYAMPGETSLSAGEEL